MSVFDLYRSIVEADGIDAGPRVAPGKSTLTAGFAPRAGFVFRSAIANAPAAPGASSTAADAGDPFGVHLLGSAGGGGVPLPAHVRSLVETTTGSALGEVTVHAGAESAARAEAIGARAYAVDRQIHLGAGASLDDTRLLVHEAVHTLQGGPAGGMSSPSDACEVEAERVADAAMSGGRAPVADGGGSSQIRRAVDPKVVAKIDEHQDVITEVATRLRIPIGLVRGIIAAESRGNADLVNKKSGYTGLMQAGKGEEHKDPATSIEAGITKFKAKARALGVKEADFDNPDKIWLVMIAYNAGEGTVTRAMKYAREAGDVAQWFAPEHFRRSLVYWGSHEPASPLDTELKGLDGDARAAELKKVQQITASHGETPEVGHAAREGAEVPGEGAEPGAPQPEDPIRKKYFGKQGWNMSALTSALVSALRAEKHKLTRTDITWAEVQATASRLQLVSIDFKHRHVRPYAEKVNAYKAAYEAGKITKPKLDDE